MTIAVVITAVFSYFSSAYVAKAACVPLAWLASKRINTGAFHIKSIRWVTPLLCRASISLYLVFLVDHVRAALLGDSPLNAMIAGSALISAAVLYLFFMLMVASVPTIQRDSLRAAHRQRGWIIFYTLVTGCLGYLAWYDFNWLDPYAIRFAALPVVYLLMGLPIISGRWFFYAASFFN
ncbi:hypothetical protein UCD39_03215 [Nitrospirillum sp. BR 11752]|uniref:hypothetical protein n=1 Tax=Nitrospirillum sp. BR 11752 TaxID=3104293 RepID=UPI002E984D34|nr:hypothetical protein [Nitrospirillum sp. BR 11752]